MEIDKDNHRIWLHDVEIDLYRQIGSLWWYDIKWWNEDYRSYVCEISEAAYKSWELARDDAFTRVEKIGYDMDCYMKYMQDNKEMNS